MIADIQFLDCVEEIDGIDVGRWRVEARMIDGSVVAGTIIGDGVGWWEEDSFVSDWDDGLTV